MTAGMHRIEAKPIEEPDAIWAAARTSATSHLTKLDPAELSFLLGVLSCTRETRTLNFPADADAALLWEYFDRHGIGGVLGACTERVAGLPPGMAEAARHRYWSNCLQGEQARRRCAVLLEASEREGLTVFFVKGPAIVEQAYGDYGLRGFSDLDLFTASAEEARRLARVCGARAMIDSERQSIPCEVWDPGRLVAELDDWTVEMRFPVPGWHGPLFDLFPNGRLPELERTASGLVVPRAEWHLLFLLQHLMIHHFFGRLVWLLDLAVLVGRHRTSLDWERVVRESKRLAMFEGLALAAGFCRDHVDPRFPEVASHGGQAWNRPFLRKLVDPSVIASTEWTTEWNTQLVSPLKRARSFLYEVAAFFLLTDAPATGRPWDGCGWQWTADRLGYALVRRWRGNWGRWLGRRLSMLAPWLVYPMARLLAWIPTRRKSLRWITAN